MDKKPLIGVSILVVVLLVLGSLSNVVGYNIVQASQQNAITTRLKQRELPMISNQQITNQLHKQILSLKSLVKTPPQKQCIIIGYFIIALLQFLTLWSDLKDETSYIFIQTFYFIFSVLFAVFWPIAIPLSIIGQTLVLILLLLLWFINFGFPFGPQQLYESKSLSSFNYNKIINYFLQNFHRLNRGSG